MKGKGETGSETESRTFKPRGWKLPRAARDSWWTAPVALLVVAAILATSVVLLTGGTRIVQEEWSAINLSLGSNPLSQQLNITFARVSYLDQPTQWNTTGFLNASLSANGAWLDNSSSYGTHYGIAQVNSTSTGTTALASWPLSSYLGANVSYAFLDQRVALNGTGTTWQLVLSEAQQTGQVATSGNVTNAAAGAAQNEIWVQAYYSAGNFSFLAYDWEEKPGGFQTVTTYAFPSNVFAPPLQFFEVYVYAQPLQTVVSIVNTTNGAVIGSTPAMHPVLDQNLTRIGYLGDTLTAAASSVDSAMIIDSALFVDHNTYANAPGASTAAIPMLAGSVSIPDAAPFDPASVATHWLNPPNSQNSYSSLTGSLSDFPSVVNSSSPASETSSLINSTAILNSTTTAGEADASHALATFRATPEDQTDAVSSTAYATTWTPQTIQSQIHSFLTNYISANTGVPAGDIEIPGMLVSNIAVWTQFSSQAASTIHDYLASAIPGFLQSNNLALVNRTTGAIDAGADIGEFMDLSTGAVYAGQTNDFGGVFDPVDHQWYASAETAGFPTGSGVGPSGAIFVPGQAAFLGWAANGEPEFGVDGCFIVCLGSALTGAASAVSNFVGSAASTVSNAVGGVTNTVSNDVIKPVSGTLGGDLSGVSTDVSKAVDQVMPFFGGTIANIGGAVQGTLSHTLSGITSGIGSAASGAAGAILSGVNSISNTIYHVGAAAGSAIGSLPGEIQSGLNVVGNTVGKVVSTSAAVLSSAFTTARNVAGAVGKAILNGGKSLLSLAGNAASAVAGALNTVGSAIVNGASGALSWVENAFGTAGADIMNAIKAIGGALNPFSWFSGFSSQVAQILEYVVIGVVAFVLVFAIVFFLHRRSKKHGSRQRGGERGRHRSRHAHRA
jgi:hypothetical protein